MTGARYLVDTSAVVRFGREPELRGEWRPQFAAGAVAICSITELEFCHSAQSKAHLEKMRARLAAAYGMTLLHYDADFLQVAEVTGQSTHWVADPGSIN